MLSLDFKNVFINSYESITSKYESSGNLKNIDNIIEDYYNGEKSFELAQVRMQKDVIDNLLRKCNLFSNDIDLIVGGDLLNQITGTTYALKNTNISFLGVYAACSTFIESLIVASLSLQNKNIKNVIAITSSHNLSSERQFRYPVEYGVLRNVNSTFTATGAISVLLSNTLSNIKINRCTIGSVVDLEISDPNMIGAIMAPAAGEVIINHLNNFHIDENYYDIILTGDLGNVGLNILKDYLSEYNHIHTKNIFDAGSKIFKNIPDINDGASGPFALPVFFFYNVLNNKNYKKILLVGTGALHSSTLVNQKETIPSIAHAIEVEVM